MLASMASTSDFENKRTVCRPGCLCILRDMMNPLMLQAHEMSLAPLVVSFPFQLAEMKTHLITAC
jgi:hypothetical protein